MGAISGGGATGGAYAPSDKGGGGGGGSMFGPSGGRDATKGIMGALASPFSKGDSGTPHPGLMKTQQWTTANPATRGARPPSIVGSGSIR